MKPILLKGVNVTLSAEGRLCLQDNSCNGCAVFAPANSAHFELRLKARLEDEWKDKAGSYCLGIMKREDIPVIRQGRGMDFFHDHMEDIKFMQQGAPLIALSTGTFRLSGRLFDKDAWSLFAGSLGLGRVLIMNFHNGRLRYRLEGQAEFTDVTSYSWCLEPDADDLGNEPLPMDSTFVPVVWVFAKRRRMYYGNWDEGIDVQCSTPRLDPASSTMSRLWEDRRFTDCVIECNGECFQAHRAVLCIGSPIFNVAFDGPMQEAQESRFEVRDCESPLAVRAMLEFMYTDVLPDLDIEVLIVLLPLAAQYQVDELFTMVAEILIGRTNVQNARAIVKAMGQFREQRNMTDLYACLMCLLKSDDDLLYAALG